MFSYFFGYTEEIKGVLDDNVVIEIKKLSNEIQTDEDKDLMYKSHTKNYELNKQIRRIATKIKLNKCVPNVYKEDDSHLDQKVPVKKRVLKHHKRNDSLESIYEVVQRLANHDQLEKETDDQLFCLHQPSPPIQIPKKNRRR